MHVIVDVDATVHALHPTFPVLQAMQANAEFNPKPALQESHLVAPFVSQLAVARQLAPQDPHDESYDDVAEAVFLP